MKTKSIGYQDISKRRVQNKNKHYWVQSGTARKCDKICNICGTKRTEGGPTGKIYTLITGENVGLSPECNPREY